MKGAKWIVLVSVLAIAILTQACATPTPQIIEKVVTKEVEKVVTRAAPESPAAEKLPPAIPEGVEPKGTITFWNAMSGSRGEVVKELVDSFNASHPNITVQAEYTGSYAETLTKALAAYRAGKPPNIVQVYEVGTETMLDSGAIVPVYTLNRGEVDFGEVVQPILKYYSVKGNLYCMPFNSSTAMLYYNKDVFRKAGLDPNRPPRTFDEVLEFGKKIKESGAAQGGISFGWPAWIFEQMHAYHNQFYANNGNGRLGLATEVYFNRDFGVKVLTEWQKWAQEGVLVYGGRKYKANDPFLSGQFAMLVQSTSSLAGIMKKANFEVGTTFLPRMPGYPRGNSVIGGGCLWVFKGYSPEELAAAWEFLKYTFQVDNAIKWHKGTGYFPTSNAALQVLLDERWFAEEPNHLTAFLQILSGADTLAARGVLLGNFVQIRDVVGTAIEEVLVNNADPKTALDKAADETNRILKEYAAMYGKK